MLFNQLSNFLYESIEPRTFFVNNRSALDQCHEGTVGVFHAHGGGTFAAFDHYLDLTILLLLRLQNAAERSHAVNLIGIWFVDSRVVLSREINRPVGGERLLKRPNRALSAYFECNFGEGENHNIANRHHWVPGDIGRGMI